MKQLLENNEKDQSKGDFEFKWEKLLRKEGPSKPDRTNQCPRCGGRLQEGYVMAPRGLWWDTKPHKLALLNAQLGEKIISQWSLTVPNVSAEKCVNCGTIII